MENKVEQILEAGIASYIQHEPLAGLPHRIVGRITLAESPHRRKALRLAFGVSASAALLLTAILWQRPPVTEKKQMAMPMVALPQPTLTSTEPVNVLPPTPDRIIRRAQIPPRLPVFPTPTPLTSEERRLVAWAEKDPATLTAAFESFRKQSEPLKIEELSIQPLDSSAGQ